MIPNVPLLDIVVEFDQQCKIVAGEIGPKLGISPHDIATFIKNHERRPVVLTNLSREIQAFERKFRHKGPEWLRANRSNITYTTAKLFAEMAKLHKDAILGNKPSDTQSLEQSRLQERVQELGFVEDNSRKDTV